MIQNILTFCLKNNLTYVEGSLPSGKLVANDVNRNSIYLITPYIDSVIKANFQTNLQSDKPTSVLGILVDGKIQVDELVDKDKSYYNLVKDWHIYEFKVPSTTLAFISRNRTGQIGINFSVEQRLVPTIKDSYGTYKGEITELGQTPTENGYYIIKALNYQYEDSIELKTFDLNDILVYNATTDVATKISAYSNRGSTPTAMYSVDPSLLNDNFETIEPSLTAQIVNKVNDNTSDIALLFQNVGVNNDTLVDLENRMSVAEQDIDTAEGNITNLQGRMETAESDIDKIENGTTIVEKALRDSLGNVIKDSYVSAIYPTYKDTMDKLYIETYGVDDVLMANNEVILPKATTTKNGLMAKEDKAYVDGLPSALALKENKSEKNQINGYAGLDSNAKVPTILLPDSILGQLEYKGTFNPSSGYPSSPEKGWFYISIGNAVISGADYKVGDWAVYNGSSWDKVDNTDAVMSVNGKIGVVILNGTEIQVGNGDTWTVEQRIVNIYAELNNRYTKAQTYSNTEIEQRLTDLLGMANLQDTAIEKSAGVFVFDNGDSILASSLAQYNWIITRFYNVDGTVQNVRYNIFKPSETTSGNRTIVQIDRTPVRYAEIKRDNGNILFRVVDESDNFDNAYVCTMKMWGIKLDGIDASEVDYDNSTSGLVADKVQGAIDEVVVELNTLENKIDLENAKQDVRINEIEELARKSASGEVSAVVSGADIINLSKNTANAPMNVNLEGGVLEAPNDTKEFVSFNKRIRSVGKNLFDKDDIIPNKWLNTTTWKEETPSTTPQNYCVSKYIVLEPNTTYRLGNRNTIRTKLFDKDLQPIASVSFIGGMETFTTTSDTKYIRMTIDVSDGGTRLNALQLEKNTISTNYAPYTTSDLYLQANAIGYSLPSGVKDTIEYRNGKYYFVKRVDDTDINNLVELSPYVETEIEAWGNLQGYENGVVYVDDIKIDASIYAGGITTTSEIKTLDEIVKITNSVETQIDTSLAVIAVDKLSFTHPDLVDGDYVWFAYEEDGNYYKATTDITYYIDKLVRTSPDGSVWKLDWSVSNLGVVTWTPTKI